MSTIRNGILDVLDQDDHRRLQAVASRHVGQDAEDVVHDAFVRALEGGDSFRGEAAPTTWLHRVIVNACVDLWRRRRRLRHREETFLGSPELSVRPRFYESVAVKVALRTLSSDEQRICILHDIVGYTHSEIAAVLQIPAGTSKSRLHGARRRLRLALGHDGSPRGG